MMEMTMMFVLFFVKWNEKVENSPNPFQVINGQAYSLSVDIYALGLTFWSIFTGRLPFDDVKDNFAMYKLISAGNLPVIPADCPMADVIKQTTALDKGQRPVAEEVERMAGVLVRENPFSQWRV